MDTAPPVVITPESGEGVGTEPSEVEQKVPFYEEPLFWVFFGLIFLLGGLVYFLVLPLFQQPLLVSFKTTDQQIEVHVDKLIAPTNGFLVIQLDNNGLPGGVAYISPFIVASTYTNFDAPFLYDEQTSFQANLDMVNTKKIYVTFYTDVNKDGVYEIDTDTRIPTDILGRKLQVGLIGGIQVK